MGDGLVKVMLGCLGGKCPVIEVGGSDPLPGVSLE